MIELPGEEIDRITFYRVDIPYREYFETSFGREYNKRTYIVLVESGGETGYGETVAGGEPRYSYETVDVDFLVTEKYIIPNLRGSTSNPLEFLDRFRWIKGYNMAKAAIEMALWDLSSKLLSKPLYKLIGGVRRYADVGVSIGLQKSIDILLDKIGKYLEEGYQRIKIKIAKNRDYEILKRVRKEYPDIKLTADANGDYSYGDIDYLRDIDEFSLLYFEQPFPDWDLYSHKKLQEILDTPVCLDESISNSGSAYGAIKLKACRVINIKPGRVGGIFESIKIHNISRDHSVGVWIGGMLETGIGRGFNVALATLPNVSYPSDISASKRYYVKDIVTEPWEIDSKGRMWVREGSGIGVEIDWEYLEKLTIWKKVFSLR